MSRLFRCDALHDLMPFLPFKNVQSTHAGVLILLESQAVLHGCFHIFKIAQMVPKRAKHFKCNKSNLHTHLPYFYSMAFCDIASKLVGIKCQIFYIPMRVCLVFLLIEFEEVQAVLTCSKQQCVNDVFCCLHC